MKSKYGIPILESCPLCGSNEQRLNKNDRFYIVKNKWSFNRGFFSKKRTVKNIRYKCLVCYKEFIFELDGEMWMLVDNFATDLWGGAGPDCIGLPLMQGVKNSIDYNF